MASAGTAGRGNAVRPTVPDAAGGQAEALKLGIEVVAAEVAIEGRLEFVRAVKDPLEAGQGKVDLSAGTALGPPKCEAYYRFASSQAFASNSGIEWCFVRLGTARNRHVFSGLAM